MLLLPNMAESGIPRKSEQRAKLDGAECGVAVGVGDVLWRGTKIG